jgi:hypothetical protein
MNTAFEDWVAAARAVPIEHESERRGIKLKGRIERVGACPKCRCGTDRFAINIKKGVWHCHPPDKGGAAMSVLPSALAFARHGHAVLPLWWPVGPEDNLVCACGRLCGRSAAKHPHSRLVRNGLRNATTDPGIIKHWFGYQLPEANLGVVTDRLIVIDVDPRHDGDLADAHQPAWRTAENLAIAVTGGGGEHIIFLAPDGVEIASFSATAMTDPPLGPGVDVRARGGHIVAPPSRHITGANYIWGADGHPAEVPLAVAPAWLVTRLTASTATAARARKSPVEPIASDVWSRLTRLPVSEYRDYAAARMPGTSSVTASTTRWWSA